MDLSVIVPCHNEESTLPPQLDALEAQVWDGDWEVVVVDNGSTDRTAEVVGERMASWSRLRLVTADAGRGLSFARNAGVAASHGRMLLFCDGDDVVADGWVEGLARALVDHELVTGRLELERLNPDWLALSRGASAAAPGPPRFAGTFAYASGGNQGMTRALFDRVGGFTEGIAGAEDMEFSLRCLGLGVEVHDTADAVVHYRYRTRAGDLFRQGRTYGACRPLIARRMKDAGMVRPPRFQGWRSWLWLVIRLPTLVTAHGRANWAWVAGNRFGHVLGSIRHRTLML
ncbi:MAG: glycosyltransferase [Actinobacteria bacterium]|nr:glycosyltransferase [Actinomycetota bacterium]NIT95199.1 glycosyltransferase [Actinomycetota bacterium]NIU18874.1 glycosyltransferase [Actinomycetota bacterium]NIV55355.1 glycosyltransferase [Actinomycetota bacterium]NIW27647.1 glycosyltransferase [Actinomycetota bacterium]